MPRISGIFQLVGSYFAVAGQTIRTEQHNPVLEDIAQALTDSLPRDGTAPMTGNLPMGGNKVTGLAAGTAAGDAIRKDQAVLRDGSQAMTGDLPMGGNKITGLSDPSAAQDGATKAYVDGEVTGLSNSLGTAATVDHGTDSGEVPLNSDLGSMSLEDAGDYVTKASKATQSQAEGGVTGDVWMDDIRVRQALEYKSLGWGQTWVDVTGSRVRGTSYQNTTGRPIMVVTNANNSSAGSLEVSADGSSWVWTGRAYNTTGDRSQAYAVVPANHYYRLVGSGSPNSWSELR